MSESVKDSAIRSAYLTECRSADDIVANDEIATILTARANSDLPVEQRMDVPTFKKRLLNLRKRGEDKGGLPRRWRR